MTSTTSTTKDYEDFLKEKIHQELLRRFTPAQRYLDGITTLPPAPTLVTGLLTLFQKPDLDVDEVVELISYEPSLTAQIFRTCNSVCFAGKEPSEDIFEAVSRVGFYRVYCLVVAVLGARSLSMEGAARGVNVNDLWRHSVAVAVSASVVADETAEKKALAFTAGLLHDIGKLVLASAEGDKYARTIQRARDEGVALSEMEKTALGIDHAELGGELMHRWDLPQDIVAAVSYHHMIEFSPPYQHLTAAVQIGDMIAHQLFPQDTTHSDILSPATVALEVLQLTSDDLPRLLAKTQAEMERVKGLLQI